MCVYVYIYIYICIKIERGIHQAYVYRDKDVYTSVYT